MAYGRLFRIWYSSSDNRKEVGRIYLKGAKLDDDYYLWELIDDLMRSEIISLDDGGVEPYDLGEYLINNCVNCDENNECNYEWDCSTSWVYVEEIEKFDEKDIEFNDIFGYTWTWIIDTDKGTWIKMDNWNQMMVNTIKLMDTLMK